MVASICVRKEQNKSTKWKGSYQLPHIYDYRVLTVCHRDNWQTST